MRYIFITLGVVLLIIFGVVIFNRGDSKPHTPAQKMATMMDYASNSNTSVVYTVSGPITGNENHRVTQISVSSSSRTITVYEGYQNQALGTQTLPNNQAAYQAFLAALNQANFLRKKVVPASVQPESICPTSNRTSYVINDGAKEVLNSWSATCTSNGSFGGNVSLTATLFQNQIPGYGNFVAKYQPQN